LRLIALLSLALVTLSLPVRADNVRILIRNRAEQVGPMGELRAAEAAVASRRVLPEFYRSRDFSPAWSDQSSLNDLVRASQARAADALDARDSHLTLIEDRSTQQPKSVLQRADLDVPATDGAIRLGYHPLFGEVDPERLDADR
jgi:hypothetical protein